MGETNSLFNDDDENPARRLGSRDTRARDEDAMSTTEDIDTNVSDVDAKEAINEENDAFEEMEEDD
jgi:hypothetical protein